MVISVVTEADYLSFIATMIAVPGLVGVQLETMMISTKRKPPEG